MSRKLSAREHTFDQRSIAGELLHPVFLIFGRTWIWLKYFQPDHGVESHPWAPSKFHVLVSECGWDPGWEFKIVPSKMGGNIDGFPFWNWPLVISYHVLFPEVSLKKIDYHSLGTVKWSSSNSNGPLCFGAMTGAADFSPAVSCRHRCSSQRWGTIPDWSAIGTSPVLLDILDWTDLPHINPATAFSAATAWRWLLCLWLDSHWCSPTSKPCSSRHDLISFLQPSNTYHPSSINLSPSTINQRTSRQPSPNNQTTKQPTEFNPVLCISLGWCLSCFCFSLRLGLLGLFLADGEIPGGCRWLRILQNSFLWNVSVVVALLSGYFWMVELGCIALFGPQSKPWNERACFHFSAFGVQNST